MDTLDAANKHLQTCERLVAAQRERLKRLASRGQENDAAQHALVNMLRLVEAAKKRRDEIEGGAPPLRRLRQPSPTSQTNDRSH